jgi:hypothetical protein
MRAWMRFITSDPEFTWGGTLFIVGATTLAGAMTGIAYSRWQRARGNWWRLLALSFLPLGAAAGAAMLPSFVLGGLAWGAKHWPLWVRILLGVGAAAWQVVGFFGALDELPSGREAVASALYLLFLGIETWAFSIMARPLRRSAALSPDTRSPLAVGGAD